MSKKEAREHCLNCGTMCLAGDIFCKKCGQKLRDNEDRSLVKLLRETFGNIFFLDSRLWVSIRSLFTAPGRMSAEFLAGKRKKYVPPVTLFLFINLLFFLVSPITDYNLALYDQVSAQPYSKLADRLVKKQVLEYTKNSSASYQEVYSAYTKKYERTSENISKIIMILNVPMIAVFYYLFMFRKRRFFYDSLVFSLNAFSAVLLIIVLGRLIDDLIPADVPYGYFIFLLFFPLLYVVISTRNFLRVNWAISLLGATVFYAGVIAAGLVYRFLIFLVCVAVV